MPHFIIECSENIIKLKTPEEIIQAVYTIADATNLFAVGDIKVRIIQSRRQTCQDRSLPN